ncbi:cheY-P phosphatase CheC [archaeon BMS3Abin16]|nr:cheY-P phosphatase CheC [archaeon BMS3Abin16]HDY74686.1 hypothetical protein [Euryarchaeota archaeon]
MSDEINAIVIDALKEISNIATASLSTVISQLTGEEISISVPLAQILNFTEITNNMPVMDTTIFTGYTPITGEISGSIVTFLTREDAIKLVEITLGQKANTSNFPTPEEKEALTELIKISSNTYTNSINTFTQTNLTPKEPETDIFEESKLLRFLKDRTKEDYATKKIVGVAITFTIDYTNIEGTIIMLLGPNILDHIKTELTENN